MVFNVGLGAGLKALLAARMGIQTAGHNVANANTPGYSRQRVLQSSSLPFAIAGNFQIGSGVQVDDISRIVDAGLEARLRTQMGLFGHAEVDHARWQELEGGFGEPENGLSTMLADMFGTVAKLQTDPSDRALRGNVVQAGRSAAEQFNLLARRIGDVRDNVPTEVAGLVREINQHAAAISNLNTEIVAMEANGSTANDLRDTREQHLKGIADLVDLRALERDNGAVDLLIGGHLLVAGSRTQPLSVLRTAANTTAVVVGQSSQTLNITGGRIAAILDHEQAGGAAMLSDLDRIAFNLALEMNRLHTTGVPGNGGFSTLTSFYGAADGDGDGDRADELIGQSGLPFDVSKGDLHVTVRNKTTGAIERTRIAIDPATMTLGDLATSLSGVDHLSATVDPTGRMRITADSNYTFDFGNRLDANPDDFGSFGGAAPSFATAGKGPFDLSTALGSGSATFTVDVDSSSYTVTIQDTEFQDTSAVTVDELVAAINADVGAVTTAKNVGGRLVLRSDSSGSSATMQLTDGAGSPLSVIGLATGVARTGQQEAVAPEVFGKYTGSGNGQFVFVPDGDGDIGVTPGLTLGVYDGNGTKVATLNVGDGYSPGDHLEVADGIKVAFGPGTVSGTYNDVFAVDTLSDSDTSDVLVALGLNSFFHGSSAADLAVNPDLERNPDLLAAGLSGAASDADNLGRILELRERELGGLSDSTIEDFYGGMVGDLGFEVAAAESSLLAQDQLLTQLQRQRETVSGVNLDEEMIDLTRHQQAFEAASRFLSVVNELSSTLINIAR